MTATVDTVGARVNQDLLAALDRELAEAVAQADAAEDNAEAQDVALNRLSELIRKIDEIRWPAAVKARELIIALLVAGRDHRDFFDLPFSDTIVRKLAREAGVELPRSGPRPRRRPAASTNH